MLDTIIIKRLKRRAATYHFDRQLQDLLKLQAQLEAQDRKLRVEIPYPTPIFWKYRKKFLLAPEIQTSKDAAVWEMVLADINISVEAKTKKVIKDKRIFIRYLSPKIYNKLGWQHKQFFRKKVKQGNCLEDVHGEKSVRYKLMKPHFFTTQIEKIYHTHYVEIISQSKKAGYISPTFIHEKIHQEYYHEYRAKWYEGGSSFKRLLNRQYKAQIRQYMQNMWIGGFDTEKPLPRWRKNFKLLYW